MDCKRRLSTYVTTLAALHLGVLAVSYAVAGPPAEPVGNAFSEPRRMTEITSDSGEWFPSVSADGLAIVFSSNRSDPEGVGGWDLYIATREATDQLFGNVRNLGAGINTQGADFQAALSADRLELYLNTGETSQRPGGLGEADIWVATRANTDEPFGSLALVPNINSEANDTAPRPSADGLTLVFTSTRAGGPGGSDVWMTRRANRNAPYETPQLVEDMFPGSQVNSPLEEWAPALSSDELALFFSESLDPPYYTDGFGEGDIWVATRADPTAPFGAPVQLGVPLNTERMDTGPSLLGAWPEVGFTIYFVSDRPGTQGVSDLWETRWSAFPLPDLVLDVQEDCQNAPLTVTADASATTTAEGTSIVSLVWNFGDGTIVEGSLETPAVEHTYTSAGSYLVTLTATNDVGESATTTPQGVCVLCPDGDATPWTVSQLGAPDFRGSASTESGTDGTTELQICAGGSAPLGNTDDHVLVHQTVETDVQLRAEIRELAGGRGRHGVGLSLRGGLTENAPMVVLTYRPEEGRVRLKYRTEAGENTRTEHFGDLTPVWLRLDRAGAAYAAFTSGDGNSWTPFAEIPFGIVALPTEVSAGVIAFGDEPVNPEVNFSTLTARLANITITEQSRFRRGDTNDDADVDIADVVYLLDVLFSNGKTLNCRVAGNINGDTQVDLSDAGFLLNFFFLGGPTPPEPYPDCGTRQENESSIPCDQASNGC